MAIMYPIYNTWNNLIFNGEKPFEFRTRLPKNLTTGTKVYIYEPVKNHGLGKVVGEFIVGDIMRCDYAIGAWPFLPYYCRNILKNDDYAKKFERALNVPETGYKKGSEVKFAFDDELMNYIFQHETWPPVEMYVYDKTKVANIDEADRVIDLCDRWLESNGFYNDFLESNYKFALEILRPVRYDAPRNLTDFTKMDGNVVEKAPQSFVYVNEIN